MLKNLISNAKPYLGFVFHLILGLVSVFTKWPIILWFYFLILNLIFLRIKIQNYTKFHFFLVLTVYLVGFEMLGRLADASPFIPYEVSKYLLILVPLLGLLRFSVRHYLLGFLMFICLLPAFFYDFSNQRLFSDLIFNGFAMLGLSLCIIFLGNVKISLQKLIDLLRMSWYPLISVLIFVFFKTPAFDKISFSMGANFETTGGEASNQVSTILGFGLVLSFYSWYNNLKFSGSTVLDLCVTIAFGFQGLLTFSRGGVLIGLIAIIIIYMGSSQNNVKILKPQQFIRRVLFYLPIFIILSFLTFNQVNKISGGKLLFRYLGETEGTLLGRKEKTFDVVTSNRLRIFTNDINIWLDHFLGGVGVGASKYIRSKIIYDSHLELSRLLAEHGILGLFFFACLIFLGFKIYKTPKGLHRTIMLTLFFIGISTSFHSASRTFITPLLVPLSIMLPANENKLVQNKKNIF